MKARVVSHIPERVLIYGVEETVQHRLSAVLQKLQIEEYRVSSGDLQKTVGCLAGLPGYGDKEAPFVSKETAVPSQKGVLCMCGLSNKRMDALLQVLREEDIRIPIRAKMTETNKDWSFGAFMEELSKEHEAVINRLKKQETQA